MEHVPFYSTNDLNESKKSNLLPLFPSWSVVCVGSSRIYNHSFGLRNQPNFKPGYLPFLLPWDIYLTVKTEQWQSDVNLIHSATNVNTETGETVRGTGEYNRRRQRRFLEEASEKGTNREKIKVIIINKNLILLKFSYLLDLIMNVRVVIAFLFNHQQKH